MGLRYPHGLSGGVLVGTHVEIGTVNMPIGHGHGVQIYFGRIFTEKGSPGNRIGWRGFGASATWFISVF